MWLLLLSFFFFFNDTATTEIYTLSLHDALPISIREASRPPWPIPLARFRVKRHFIIILGASMCGAGDAVFLKDRKSTRLNSSHLVISYAVFCLKKKKNTTLPSDKYFFVIPI